MDRARTGQFWLLLNEAGMSKLQLAQAIGKRYDTVIAWGDTPPQYVIAYLLECVKVRRLQREYDRLMSDPVTREAIERREALSMMNDD
jgi:hypothetical protein